MLLARQKSALHCSSAVYVCLTRCCWQTREGTADRTPVQRESAGQDNA